jgi:hypothetical protein
MKKGLYSSWLYHAFDYPNIAAKRTTEVALKFHVVETSNYLFRDELSYNVKETRLKTEMTLEESTKIQ